MFVIITEQCSRALALALKLVCMSEPPLVSSHFLSRTCDRALPSKAPDGGAESAPVAVAPPGHLYPQWHHSWPGRQREGCYRQPVPSPLRPDGAQPD